MLSVYRVLPDLDSYQHIMTDDIDSVLQLQFDGTPMSSTWPLISLYIPNPRKPRPSFFGCAFEATAFCVDYDVASSIGTFIDQSCETIPVAVESRRLLLCNTTRVNNALNHEQTRFIDNSPYLIDKYVFHPGRLEYSLFKLPETAMAELLCVEGLASPEDEFKGCVERLGLTGLRFQRIWCESND